MARARNIKPGFFTNELLGTADPMVCLTFAGLWCLADKEGILEDRSLRIKAELFPYRESLDVNGYLTELSRLGFIQRYQHGDSSYIKVRHFRKHQSPHHTEKAKGYPEPDNANSLIQADNGYVTVKQPGADGDLTVPERSDSLIPDSLIPDSLIADSPQPSAAVRARRKRRPPAPVSEIVDLYLSNLPDLPGVVTITDKRKRHIETVHAGIMESELDNWRGYFQAVARSAFLTGKVKDWRADFDFLIKPETPIKVLEGKYA